MSARCSRCGAEHDRAGRYCRACHAAYMRRWRGEQRRKLDEAVEALAALRRRRANRV